MNLNILDDIYVFLKLSLSFRIYRLLLDQSNLMYIVCLIWKQGFWDLPFFEPKNYLIGLVLMIMVFVYKIEDAIRLERYL